MALKQLRTISNIPVHYVFITRYKDNWTKPIIIRQDYLLDHFENDQVGSEHKGYINFYFSYKKDRVECSGQDFSKYVCDDTICPKKDTVCSQSDSPVAALFCS